MQNCVSGVRGTNRQVLAVLAVLAILMVRAIGLGPRVDSSVVTYLILSGVCSDDMYSVVNSVAI